MKNEYMAQVWGGFFNKENFKIHNIKPGYYFFNNENERKEFIENLQKQEKLYGILAISLSEGNNLRYRTIAKCIFKYKNKIFNIDYDFGFAYSYESALYMFNDGNYSCDCNRSVFISEKYKNFPELDCGEEIKLLNISVEHKEIGFIGVYHE